MFNSREDSREERTHRINREIRIPEVRVTMPDGTSLVMPTFEALRKAEELGVDLVEVAPKARPPVCKLIDYGKFKYQELGVDLVEVAPKARPPVCKLIDYGKFKYQEQKRAQEAKAKQKVTQVKEVKFRPATDDNDFQTKIRSVRRFIEGGDKAKITLRYRGREMAHQEFGADLLERVKTELADIAQVEQKPKLEGRQMIMVLGPKRKK